ncbi:peptidoglycan D,D-transpeptidase FtsI family protein [Stratiformator vulcanicus]|uniref:beta-lactamase n=1 Tax=Stratiformator vulcanicus TaxID=2527980 RepID=A0A517R3S9_9PLAN|nr:penicillin-binding transpeptidase domain-containing protein [Stratiformator vulcanicus]QDT38493.1 Penicillin-binding protein [Stratiformator vulcanicus]
MRNAPTNPYVADHRQHRLGADDGCAAAPDRRLRWMSLLLILPLAAGLFRLAWVQQAVAAREEFSLSPLRSRTEPIPARDGRILSRDGLVLAEDQQQFEVRVHFRSIEEPPDEQWLDRQARSLLRSRRNSATSSPHLSFAEARREALERRNALWTRLAELTGVPEATLAQRRREITEEVRRVYEAVLARREEQQEEQEVRMRAWWEVVRDELTTAPKRYRNDPLVIVEQTVPHVVIDSVSLTAAAAIESAPERFPGVQIAPHSKRSYPLGATAAHVIGYALEDQEGAAQGKAGIERTFDLHLRGTEGQRRVWFESDGSITRTEVLRRPQIGQDLVLTLNARLQRQIEEILKAAVGPDSGGAVVVSDVASGEVLVLASAPTFDLNAASDRHPEFWTAANEDPSRRLFHRAVAAALPPGDLFKPVTGVAAVESGGIKALEPFECVGFLDNPSRHRCEVYLNVGIGHGPLTLPDALASRCQVYFYHAGRTAGSDALLHWADKFGFGRATGIALPGEAKGRLPRFNGGGLDEDRLLEFAIGQSTLTATPLQVAQMTAAIANGGRIVRPRLIAGYGASRVGDRRDMQIRSINSDRQLDLDAGTISALQKGFELSAQTIEENPDFAGRIGFAQVGRSKAPHAWFAGFLPAKEPQLAVTIVLEHRGNDGEAVTRTVRAILAQIRQMQSAQHGL